MAFLGDFGKYFLGGASTGDVARTVAVASGADPFTAAAIGSGSNSTVISRRNRIWPRSEHRD